MQEVLLLKCGELVLKGLNRRRFEDKLIRTVKDRMKRIGEFDIWYMQSTIYVEPMNDDVDMEEALQMVKPFPMDQYQILEDLSNIR